MYGKLILNFKDQKAATTKDAENGIMAATSPGSKETETANTKVEEGNDISSDDSEVGDGIDNVEEQHTHSIKPGLYPSDEGGKHQSISK